MKKRTNMKFILMFIIGFLVFEAEAQITPIDYINNNGRFTIRSRVPFDIDIPYEPYLNSEARFATLELLEGDSVEGFYKYNLETESLENVNSDEIYTLRDVKRFSFAATENEPAESFVNIRLVWPTSEYGGFFRNVNNSDFVKVKHYLEYLEADYDPKLDVGNPYNRVEKSQEFYVKLNNQWTSIPQRRNPFINAMAAYIDEKELKKFIRKNRIKLDEAEDVAKVIDFIAEKSN